MTMFNGKSVKAFAAANGGKGLILALALAGAGLQGCTTEDTAAGPAGTDTAATVAVLEDEKGADLNADGSPVNPEPTAVDSAKIALGKAAPSCVRLWTRKSGTRSYATLQNYCSTPQRIRIIWRWAADGECITLWQWNPYEHTYEESRLRPAYVTEVRGC